jgi:hypothetical protein
VCEVFKKKNTGNWYSNLSSDNIVLSADNIKCYQSTDNKCYQSTDNIMLSADITMLSAANNMSSAYNTRLSTDNTMLSDIMLSIIFFFKISHTRTWEHFSKNFGTHGIKCETILQFEYTLCSGVGSILFLVNNQHTAVHRWFWAKHCCSSSI